MPATPLGCILAPDGAYVNRIDLIDCIQSMTPLPGSAVVDFLPLVKELTAPGEPGDYPEVASGTMSRSQPPFVNMRFICTDEGVHFSFTDIIRLVLAMDFPPRMKTIAVDRLLVALDHFTAHLGGQDD